MNGRLQRRRIGRYQISYYRNEKTIPLQKDDNCGCDKTRAGIRACVQYSRPADGEWQRQRIWCAPEELRYLSDALDQLTTGEPLEDAE